MTQNLVRLDQLHKILQRNDSPVDERRAVDIVYLAFTKAAGTVSPMIIIKRDAAVQAERAESEVECKCSEWSGPKGADQ